MDFQALIIPAFLACIGLAVASATIGVINLIGGSVIDNRLRQRLKGVAAAKASHVDMKEKIKGLANRIGDQIARPFVDDDGERKASNRRKLISAGIYGTDAPKMLVGAQMLLAFLGLGGGVIVHLVTGMDWIMAVPGGGVVGYMAPKFWVSRKIKANHKALETGLPDGLDLMVVCVEAGLTLDAAMKRVGEELQLAHPALSRELGICHMETQIGLPRQTALRNLGERTNFTPLQALAAMLIQADRFGTSIAKALQIQASSMRSKRQHKAEEAAAKASVKLTFPLVLFIFPATFIVLMGPTVLKMMNSSIFN